MLNSRYTWWFGVYFTFSGSCLEAIHVSIAITFSFLGFLVVHYFGYYNWIFGFSWMCLSPFSRLLNIAPLLIVMFTHLFQCYLRVCIFACWMIVKMYECKNGSLWPIKSFNIFNSFILCIDFLTFRWWENNIAQCTFLLRIFEITIHMSKMSIALKTFI